MFWAIVQIRSIQIWLVLWNDKIYLSSRSETEIIRHENEYNK